MRRAETWWFFSKKRSDCGVSLRCFWCEQRLLETPQAWVIHDSISVLQKSGEGMTEIKHSIRLNKFSVFAVSYSRVCASTQGQSSCQNRSLKPPTLKLRGCSQTWGCRYIQGTRSLICLKKAKWAADARSPSFTVPGLHHRRWRKRSIFQEKKNIVTEASTQQQQQHGHITSK